MEAVTPILKPDRGLMIHHLGLLFARELSGRIELTGIKAGDSAARPHTRFFNLDEIDEAADCAVEINT
ncbi:hypothetical protein BT096_11785, partial [Corynebacterium diphtheriae]